MPLTTFIKQVLYGAALWAFAAHLVGASVQAQEYGVVVEKKDGKFSGTLTADTQNTYYSTYPHFVSNIELRFAWTALLGQPVEQYQFIWQPSGRISYNFEPTEGLKAPYNSGTFHRYQLDKYPDLQRRFDQMKPTDVKLSMRVQFDSGLGYFISHDGLDKIITEVPRLLVFGAGKVGDTIIPSSPADWRGFFETSNMSGSPEEINRDLQDRMRRTDKIRVHSLRLDSYRVPDVYLKSIIREYYKREKKEAEKELEEEAAAADDDESDDYWSGESESSGDKGSGDNEEEDDFWNGGSDKEPGGADSGDDDDFWSGEDTEVEQKNEKTDDFWRNSQSDQAVKNSLKKAERNRKLIRTDEIQDCGTLAVYSFDEGYVDANGNWLTPPNKKIRAHFKGWWRGMSSNDERNTLEYKYGIGWNQPRAKREFKERCTRQADAEKRRMGASNAK